MWIDPIIKEVRNAGEELAKKANYDVHAFFQILRDNEKKRKTKTVSRDTTAGKTAQPGIGKIGLAAMLFLVAKMMIV
jgi:hypothetical protein